MTVLRVDLDRLAALVERMASYQSQLARLYDEAEARQRALHTTWQGSAASAQQLAAAQWLAGADEVHEALAVLRSIADGAHANYTAAVAANRRMWAG